MKIPSILNQLQQSLSHGSDILGRDRFFNSAVLIPFISVDNELHLLFQKRAENIRQGKEICFPGGGFDPAQDHDFQDTAIRETHEEMSLDPSQVFVIGKLGTVVAPMGAIIESYIGFIPETTIDQIQPDKNEVESIFTLPLSYFLENEPDVYHVQITFSPKSLDKQGNTVEIFPAQKLDLPSKYHRPWPGKKRRVYVYETEYGVIWGLTAEILVGLVSKITGNCIKK